MRELGIGFVAYSPLGRGFLTGAIKQRDDLEQGDWRLSNPRSSEEAIANNQKNDRKSQRNCDWKKSYAFTSGIGMGACKR